MSHPFLVGMALGAIGLVAVHVLGWLIGARLAERAAR